MFVQSGVISIYVTPTPNQFGQIYFRVVLIKSQYHKTILNVSAIDPIQYIIGKQIDYNPANKIRVYMCLSHHMEVI